MTKKERERERRIPFTIQSWHGFRRMSSVRNMRCFSTKMTKRLLTRCFFLADGGGVTEGLILES